MMVQSCSRGFPTRIADYRDDTHLLNSKKTSWETENQDSMQKLHIGGCRGVQVWGDINPFFVDSCWNRYLEKSPTHNYFLYTPPA